MKKKIFIGVVVFVVAIGIISAIGGSKPAKVENQKATSQGGETLQQNQPTSTPDPNPHFVDGTFAVGKDIQPGTYRTRVASVGCYYERMADFTGGINSTLANDNTDYPAIVTILATDKGFKSKRCGTWTQDLTAITKIKTTFIDGMYIVGTDIQPGTYKSSGQTSCYYERMADFTGGINSTLANENTDTAAIVTITSSDKGFKSSRCGTWTLQE
ncbi:MAG: conserved hypothetical cytosolic protein [Microgenomates group bacterium Gr01-1014_7]|nr:MAG: conserved hypothetical cytosolic protein [Microgenomates group bacterium Gr01-1014_7]